MSQGQAATALCPIAAAVPERPRNPRARVYVIEGEIAAGKTELARALAANLRARGLSVCLVLEPVEAWRAAGILQKFYADPGRHGYGFQTFVFSTRVAAIANAVALQPEADVYLLERSPATDAVFMELQRGLVDPAEMTMYGQWCDMYRRLLPIDLASARVLYLRTSLDSCMARLAQRGREGEVAHKPGSEGGAASHDGSATGGVSIEYQQRLRRAHEAFLLGGAGGSPEFPLMPLSPFGRDAVIEIGPEIADDDFRMAAGRPGVVDAIVSLMGL